MCTYNGDMHIESQLRSIAEQSTLPSELIICDDKSSDNTKSIIRNFKKNAPFKVKLTDNTDNLGPVRNFAQAIQKCQYDTIFLCDQDDIWAPEKIEATTTSFQENPLALYAFSDATMIDNNGQPTGRSLWKGFKLPNFKSDFRKEKQLQVLLQQNVVTGAAMAIKASLKQAALPIPVFSMHDYWLAILGSTISFGVTIPAPLIKYRIHPKQACGWGKKGFFKSLEISLKSNERDSRKRLSDFKNLQQRLAHIAQFTDIPKKKSELIDKKTTHLTKRCDIRTSNALSKPVKVISETLSGRYHNFSDSNRTAWESIARDLCL